MPLRWNVHFFPQSMYCNGLYRHLHTYDFVGHMGPRFYHDVHAMGEYYKHSSLLAETLESVFDLDNKIRHPPEHVGVEESASSHILEYYTPHSLRRVLQYMSADYVLLGLSIPNWAQEMLDRS